MKNYKIIPEFIISACEWAKENDKTLAKADGKVGDINLSTIWTLLIQVVGRFVESYASDLLINIKTVEDFIEHKGYHIGSTLFLFGLRDSGVDDISFIVPRLISTANMGGLVSCERVYRKLYAMYVAITGDDVHVELVDISSAIHRISGEYWHCLERDFGLDSGAVYGLQRTWLDNVILLQENVPDGSGEGENTLFHAFKKDWLEKELAEKYEQSLDEFLSEYTSEESSDLSATAIFGHGILFTYNTDKDCISEYASNASGLDIVREESMKRAAVVKLTGLIGHEPLTYVRRIGG